MDDVYTAMCIFFFQAEDGIRDSSVTGVQTCALPISGQVAHAPLRAARRQVHRLRAEPLRRGRAEVELVGGEPVAGQQSRSEERRVGKECRSRWSPYH